MLMGLKRDPVQNWRRQKGPNTALILSIFMLAIVTWTDCSCENGFHKVVLPIVACKKDFSWPYDPSCFPEPNSATVPEISFENRSKGNRNCLQQRSRKKECCGRKGCCSTYTEGFVATSGSGVEEGKFYPGWRTFCFKKQTNKKNSISHTKKSLTSENLRTPWYPCQKSFPRTV